MNNSVLESKNECLHDFHAAVLDARRGDYGLARRLVERVRENSGDAAAEIARRELWAYVKSEKVAA